MIVNILYALTLIPSFSPSFLAHKSSPPISLFCLSCPFLVPILYIPLALSSTHSLSLFSFSHFRHLILSLSFTFPEALAQLLSLIFLVPLFFYLSFNPPFIVIFPISFSLSVSSSDVQNNEGIISPCLCGERRGAKIEKVTFHVQF